METPEKRIERFKQEVAFKLSEEELTELTSIARQLKNYDFNTICEKLDNAIDQTQYIS